MAGLPRVVRMGLPSGRRPIYGRRRRTIGTLLDNVPRGIVRWSCVICRSNLSRSTLAKHRRPPPRREQSSPRSQSPSTSVSFHSSRRLSLPVFSSLSLSPPFSPSYTASLEIVRGFAPREVVAVLRHDRSSYPPLVCFSFAAGDDRGE